MVSVAAALASVKSVGQAALGVTILWGLPVFVNEGARQMADVPMAFFILATAVAAVSVRRASAHPGLLVLAGLTAGLGAWTKNEGAVLVVGAGPPSCSCLAVASAWRPLLRFAAGLALPLVGLAVLQALHGAFRRYPQRGRRWFAGTGSSDLSRHAVILQYLWSELTDFGGWGISGLGLGILPILLLYYAVFSDRRSPPEPKPAFVAGFIILGIQLLGYYAAYLVSPYELGVAPFVFLDPHRAAGLSAAALPDALGAAWRQKAVLVAGMPSRPTE